MTNSMNRLAAAAAIAYAARHGLALSSYADPTDDAASGLSVAEAERIAAEDPSLIFIEIPHLEYVAYMHVADCLSQGCSPAELAGQSDDDALEGWDANGICDALGLDPAKIDLYGDEYAAGCRRLAREIRAEARRIVEAA